MSKRAFTWLSWDFDCDGAAYIIAKGECPKREDVPDYICTQDSIHPDCKPEMVIEEGWCKWQVRTDWDNCDGEPRGWYVVETYEPLTRHSITGKRKSGWFPVWIVRQDEWY